MNHDQLINDHWGYVESILDAHGVKDFDVTLARAAYLQGFRDGLEGREPQDLGVEIKIVIFHYRTSYAHGKKHREEGNNGSDKG